jgi:hypothetical protein
LVRDTTEKLPIVLYVLRFTVSPYDGSTFEEKGFSLLDDCDNEERGLLVLESTFS